MPLVLVKGDFCTHWCEIKSWDCLSPSFQRMWLENMHLFKLCFGLCFYLFIYLFPLLFIYLFIYLFLNFNFVLLFNYSCVPFLPIPPPHPSWTSSLPHLHPPPWFGPCVLYSSFCNPLSSLSPPHSPLPIVRLFLNSMSLVIFCFLFSSTYYVLVKGEIIWYFLFKMGSLIPPVH